MHLQQRCTSPVKEGIYSLLLQNTVIQRQIKDRNKNTNLQLHIFEVRHPAVKKNDKSSEFQKICHLGPRCHLILSITLFLIVQRK